MNLSASIYIFCLLKSRYRTVAKSTRITRKATQPQGTFCNEKNGDAGKSWTGTGDGVGACWTTGAAALAAARIVVALVQARVPLRPSAEVTVTEALFEPLEL